jgi:glycosyltransferase involved in cell wall biosynthesis
MSSYVQNGENGFTIKFNDTKELTRVLNFLNSNRNLLPQISTEGKKIYPQFSWQAVLEKYKQLYV